MLFSRIFASLAAAKGLKYRGQAERKNARKARTGKLVYFNHGRLNTNSAIRGSEGLTRAAFKRGDQKDFEGDP
jgi:hypothetical protein